MEQKTQFMQVPNQVTSCPLEIKLINKKSRIIGVYLFYCNLIIIFRIQYVDTNTIVVPPHEHHYTSASL